MRLRAFAERGKAGPAVAAAVIVVGLLMVTAIASRQPLNGVGKIGTPTTAPYGRSQINAPAWSLALVAVGAAVALCGALVAIRWQVPRRHKRDEEMPRRVIQIPLVTKLVALLIPMLVAAVLIVAAIEGSRSRTPIRPGTGSILPRPGRSPKPRQFTSYHPPGWIVPAIVGVALAGAGAALLLVALRRRFGEGIEFRPVFRVDAALEEAVEESLEDLRGEPDPRRAVIAAYRRMEATLAEAGLARRDWEAPREYAGRVHNHLELSARPLETLTALFERARFGVGAVDERLRERAIAALMELRDEVAQVSREMPV